MQVLGDVRSELAANPEAYADGYQTILSIVQAGEEICDSLAEDGVPLGVSVPGEVMTATPSP